MLFELYVEILRAQGTRRDVRFQPNTGAVMRYFGEGTCSAGCVDLLASDFFAFMP